MNVLMVGVDESTKGGMWTVVQNYLNDARFCQNNHLVYVPVSIVGRPVQKLLFMGKGFRNIRQVFRTRKVDIVHVHMSERGSVYRKGMVMRYAKKHGAKIVLHMHGAELEVWYNSLTAVKQAKVREIIDLADKILILGNYWKDFMASLVSDPGRIRVVCNAVAVPERPLFRKEARNLLFLGAISRRKGIYDLLDAMKNIEEQLPETWKLKLYGPDVMGNIEEEITKRGLEGRVQYCGWLSGPQKAGVLADPAVNILPSYHEGLPMTILEAMAGGIPSVTTRVAAIPEAVTEENGSLLEPGDVEGLGRRILELCEDEDLREKKSQAACRTVAGKFSLQKHLDEIQKIYEELLRS